MSATTTTDRPVPQSPSGEAGPWSVDRAALRPARAERHARRAMVRPVLPRLARPPVPDAVAAGMQVLITVALLAGWVVLQALLLSTLSQGRAQETLYAQFREQLAEATAPTGGQIRPGSPVALLQIPTLGMEQVVVEGTAAGDLLSGPGHRRDTALPGQPGVVVVYGRASTYGAPFRSVTELAPGDGITVQTAQGESTYRVDGVRRDGDPLPMPLVQGNGRLTLVTAEGRGRFAAITPTSSVFVDATLVTQPYGAPGGRPTAVPPPERAMAPDPSVLPLLALCLQGLLAAGIGIVLARRRWGWRRVWVVAVPVVLTLAWLTSDAAIQLMPNLI